MSEWRDISTAPKDGTRILASWIYHYPDDKAPTIGVEIVEWYTGKIDGWLGEDGVAADSAHTHWMPLPDTPYTIDANTSD